MNKRFSSLDFLNENSRSSTSDLEAPHYFLFDGIYDESAKNVVEWLLKASRKHDELKLYINSPGGDLAAAKAITSMMEAVGSMVTTIAIGQVASAGTYIAVAGDRRLVYPDTSIMMHQYSTGAWGKHHDLMAHVKENNLTHDRMIAHFVKHTGLPAKQVEKVLLTQSDTWLTAEEAIKLGMFDAIIQNEKNSSFKRKARFLELADLATVFNDILGALSDNEEPVTEALANILREIEDVRRSSQSETEVVVKQKRKTKGKEDPS